MIDLIPTPTRRLKVGAAIAKWALSLVAMAWLVLVLLWAGLHFLIVPRIGELRPWLEQQASQALGLQVRIASIQTRSNGLMPSFALNQVTLHDAQQREVLRLPQVLVAVSVRSALRLGFEQVYVDSPELDVRRTADGQVWVAGVAIAHNDAPTNPVLDWVFSQAEMALVHGTVRWTDELRGAPVLALTQVNAVLRNGVLSHTVRVDATPPAHWGQRVSLQGVFREPLLSHNAGDWAQWYGEVYADLPQVDVAQLRPYVDLGVRVAQGVGGLRVWADIEQARVRSATADVRLRDVRVRVHPTLAPLQMQRVSGRLGLSMVQGGVEFFTEALAFDTVDGLRWPGGNVRLAIYPGNDKRPAQGSVSADRLDLAAMVQVLSRLPLGTSVHTALAQLAPRGLVQQVQAHWQGPIEQMTSYSAKGKIQALGLSAHQREGSWVPGFQGLDVDFDVQPEGGHATIAMKKGSLDARTLFADPLLQFDTLRGDVQWKLSGDDIAVEIDRLQFSNADAKGELHARWHTTPVHQRAGKGRFPGVLDMQGHLDRGEGTRVYRYLPQVLGAPLIDYLHDGLVAGHATDVQFKVQGNLFDFPFIDPAQGEFRIAADVHDASYAYAPARILPPQSLPWPMLTQLSGTLLIDRGVLTIEAERGGLQGLPSVNIRKARAVITQLYGDAELVVNAQATGSLRDGLGMVNQSPLGDMLGGALAQTTATGNAQYQIQLGFPIADVEQVRVQGSVTLAGNDVQMTPDTPLLGRARGVVAFTENSFNVTGGQARIVGGDARIEGGMRVASSASARGTPPVLRVHGMASAEGLRQAHELGPIAQLASYATGATPYNLTLGLREGALEWQVNSNLVGLVSNLPAPFAKAAATPMPLRFAVAPQQPHETWQLELGQLLNAYFVRTADGTQVLRGSIGLGLAQDEFTPMPLAGISANVRLDDVDVDAWQQVLQRVSATPSTSSATEPMAGAEYFPTRLAVRANTLRIGGRSLNRLVLGAAREANLWRANIDATELSGYVEYRQPAGASAGNLHARLARLVIGANAAQDVESLLDEQPASIPALDVVVEDFELRGKKLGRLEIDAVNLGAGLGVQGNRDTPREWRLNHFNLITPEASLNASGNWANVNAQMPSATTRIAKNRRRTVLNFKLDMKDAGQLLERFGMKGVVRKGRGKLEGQVAWMGSPLSLDYPSMSGNFNINVETGQFLKADPGLAKLLGVLSLQSLPRRLVLDFRDVFSEGFAFDFVRGDATIEQGIARTQNLKMKGVNAAVLLEGQADIAKETQTLRVVVVPEINAGSASVLASIINPIVGLSTFLAQAILRRPLIDANTQEFLIDGTWMDPRVTKVETRLPETAP